MRTRHLFLSCALGLGLALAVLGFTSIPHAPASAAPTQGTRYVAVTGIDTDNDCTSQSSPCRTIQHAVDVADEGDLIKVAAGTYTDLHARPRADIETTGTVTQVVYLSKTVTIRGGYTTTNWTAWSREHNETVLDAGGQGRVVYITGEISPTLEGLQMTGGDATGLGGLSGQDAGGGVYVITATATLNRNAIFENFARDDGGGVCLVRTDRAALRGNRISRNEAGLAGGVEVRLGQDTAISGNRIDHNVAVDASGGGIALIGGAGATIDNNVIADNQVESSGGALYVYVDSARLRHNTLARNVGGGGDGTGIHLVPHWTGQPATVAMTNTILVGHQVGIDVDEGCTATLESTLWGEDAWANGADWDGDGAVVPGGRNYWGDPDFVDPDAVDYHIGPKSAAIDSGVPIDVETDIDGQERPIGHRPDLGADEAWHRMWLPLIVREP